MRHYRGLFLLAAFLLVLASLFLQPGEARNTECACKPSGPQQGRTDEPQQEPQEQSKVPLDATRAAALRQLYEEVKAGAPVIRQEADVLMRHVAGEYVSALEADVVISRVLYDFYGRGLTFSALTAEQESLLMRYKEAFAHQPQNIEIRTELLSVNDLGLSLDRSTPFSIDEVLPLAPAGGVANDQCVGAIAIPGTGPFPIAGAITPDITAATLTGDPGVPSCQTSISRSVWYTFTPANTGFYEVTTCADNPTGTTVDDTVMAIYTSTGGCAGPFTELATNVQTDGCDDDTCVTESLQSVINTSLSAGQTYYVAIWKFGTSAPTFGNTAVQPVIDLLPTPPTPANDTCAVATPLTLNIPVAGNSTGFTANDYQLALPSTCFTGTGNTATTATGRDVVYSFTAPSAGQYSFRAWQYVSTGTSNVAVYLASTCPAATPGTPVNVSCFAAANFQTSTGGEELNCVSLTAGQQVFFFVDEATIGVGATFYALVETCGAMETESNNTPATANPLSCGIQGAVNPATEADFYSIGTPPTGSRLFAMIDASTAGPSADVDLRVNTLTDTVEFDDLDLDVEFGVSGFAPSIAGTVATGVPLFYQVDRFGAAPTGTGFPYRLYSVVQPPSTSAAPETEPNNTTATATTAANNYFAGALAGPAPSTDVDIYGFQAQAGDRIMLNLDGDPLRNNTPVDTRLELLDSAGTPLVNVNGSGSTVNVDNANPPGLFETVPQFPSEALVFRAPTSGIFYARVSAAVTGATGVGDYLLSISKNCTIGAGGICILNAAADITVSNDSNQCGAVVTYPAPTTSGTCGTVTCSPASGSFFPKGTTTVTCMASTSGATDSFTITVNDTQAPSITCPSNIVIGVDPGVNSAVVTYPPPTASDNCPGVMASYGIASGSTFPLGDTTVIGTATDASGNTATCSFTVTVLERHLSVADATITEGNSGATNLVFTVTLTPSSTQTVMVDFFSSNGTATTPSDYQSVSGTLTFAPGQLTRTITVPVNGDTLPEGHETFFVNLTNPTNAIISDAQGIGTITDDDATSIFQFNASSVIVSENAGSATLTVTRTGDTSAAASLKFETSDLTAKQKSDYTFGSGTVQFDPGNTSKTLQVLLVNDAFVEGSEMFQVDLSNPSGSNAVGSPSTTFVTIIDDDSVPTTANPIDQAQFFVRQQYLDFLARETDPSGLSFWTNEITSCGSDANCISAKRVNVSAAFFLSIEFQETSGNVIRTQRVAFGRHSIDPATRVPFLQFMRDTRQVAAGVIVGQPGFLTVLEQNKQAYAQQIEASAEFLARFPIAPAGPYVDALFASAVVTPTAAERQAAINAFGAGGTVGRVAALRSASDSDSLRQVEFRPSFVLVQYYGYLRRSPTDLPDVDDSGYQFWLAKLNFFNGDFVAAEMVKSFLVSTEYRGRFGQP